MEKLKKIIGKNLSDLRKERKLTQLEIAQMFGYSDKAVSKREKGDTIPDVETLYQLATYYGVTLDYLTSDSPKEEKENMVVKKETTKREKINLAMITMLVVSIIWMLATITYVWLLSFNGMNVWTIFLWAIPASSLALYVFNTLWGKRSYIFYISTVFIWGLILAIYFQFIEYHLRPFFMIGVPAQISLLLWASLDEGFIKTLKKNPKRNKTNK